LNILSQVETLDEGYNYSNGHVILLTIEIK